ENVVRVFAVPAVPAKCVVTCFHDVDLWRGRVDRLQNRAFAIAAPAPGVAKPNGRQQMEGCGLGSAVRRRCADQNVVRRYFGVINLDVEETLVRERVCVPKFELALYL